MNISDAAREAVYPICDIFDAFYRQNRVKVEEAVQTAINTATAALTLELDTVKRDKQDLLNRDAYRENLILELRNERAVLRGEVKEVKAERDQLRQQLETTKEECKALTEAFEDNIGEKVAEDLGTAQFEIDQLRQQLAEAREDSKRLDLLSKLAEHRVELFRNAAGRITLYVKDAPTDDDFVQAFAPTVRGTIDAALSTLNSPTDEK